MSLPDRGRDGERARPGERVRAPQAVKDNSSLSSLTVVDAELAVRY